MKCQVLLQSCCGIHSSSASQGWGGTAGETPSLHHCELRTNGRGGRNGSCFILELQSPQSLLESAVQQRPQRQSKCSRSHPWRPRLEPPTPRPLNSLAISFLVINNHDLKYLVWFLLPKLNSADTTTRGLTGKAGRPRDKAKPKNWVDEKFLRSQVNIKAGRPSGEDRSSTGPGRQAQSHKHRQWALTLEKKLFQSTWFHRRV